MIAITYIGKSPGFTAKIKKREYAFEWKKSLGVGKGKEEVLPDHAAILATWRDRRGKKIFFVE